MSNPFIVCLAVTLGLVMGVAVTPTAQAAPAAASAPASGGSTGAKQSIAPCKGPGCVTTDGMTVKKPIVPGDKPVTTNKVVTPAAKP